MNIVLASGEVLKVYQTGDRPILILCSDGYHYICKYKLPGSSASKLLNEYIGSCFAKVWGIVTPITSFVSNDPIIWGGEGASLSHDPGAPLIGSRLMENVVDISDFNCGHIPLLDNHLEQLLKIALFDIWLANEDRTCNNYNLLFDLRKKNIVSIDYGGVFNSGVFTRPLYQLNESDSIISSGLFDQLKGLGIERVLSHLRVSFYSIVDNCKRSVTNIIETIPATWMIDRSIVENKILELFSPSWINDSLETFVYIINFNNL